MSRTGSAYRRSGYAKKMAAIAVALMSVAVIWTVLSEESEATGDDYTRYYYDQLDQIGKAVYDKALTLEPGESSFDIALNMDWFDDDSVTNVKHTLDSTLSEIRMALVSEKPELYWMGTGLKYIVTGGTITYSFPTAFSTNSEEKAAFDQAVENFHIDNTNRYTAVKSIHDGLASTLTYSSTDNEENSSVIRSAYTALAGDHNVVAKDTLRVSSSYATVTASPA